MEVIDKGFVGCKVLTQSQHSCTHSNNCLLSHGLQGIIPIYHRRDSRLASCRGFNCTVGCMSSKEAQAPSVAKTYSRPAQEVVLGLHCSHGT